MSIVFCISVTVLVVSIHCSCCMHVNNIERKMYFLPRAKKLDKNGQETDEDVTIMDVYQVC